MRKTTKPTPPHPLDHKNWFTRTVNSPRFRYHSSTGRKLVYAVKRKLAQTQTDAGEDFARELWKQATMADTTILITADECETLETFMTLLTLTAPENVSNENVSGTNTGTGAGPKTGTNTGTGAGTGTKVGSKIGTGGRLGDMWWVNTLHPLPPEHTQYGKGFATLDSFTGGIPPHLFLILDEWWGFTGIFDTIEPFRLQHSPTCKQGNTENRENRENREDLTLPARLDETVQATKEAGAGEGNTRTVAGKCAVRGRFLVCSTGTNNPELWINWAQQHPEYTVQVHQTFSWGQQQWTVRAGEASRETPQGNTDATTGFIGEHPRRRGNLAARIIRRLGH